MRLLKLVGIITNLLVCNFWDAITTIDSDLKCLRGLNYLWKVFLLELTYSNEFSTKNLDCVCDFWDWLFTPVEVAFASVCVGKLFELFDKDDEEFGLFKPNEDKGFRAWAVRLDGDLLLDSLLFEFKRAKLVPLFVALLLVREFVAPFWFAAM